MTAPGRLNFGVTPGNEGVLKEAALVLMKDAKNPRPGPSLYRVSFTEYYKLKF